MSDKQTLERNNQQPLSAQKLSELECFRDTYRITRTISESPNSVVYKADEKRSKRSVVIKVIRHDSIPLQDRMTHARDTIEKMEHLKHRGLATVLEVGITPEGWFYHVSEYAKGMPINEYATIHKLPLRDRFAIFMKACQAVNHAHQHCVLHRDIRPSKIIVDGKGNPKIAGLGIAAITDLDVEFSRLDDGEEGRKALLAYKSPEQVAGKLYAVDVRSDVYALGVILYELLTDRLPFDLASHNEKEILQIISKQLPRKPRTFRPSLKGDLEAIVLKSLSKDPAKRYQSTVAFSQDLKNFFDKRPVLARPSGAFYEFSKLATRYRSRFISMAILSLAVITFGVHIHLTTRRADRLLLQQQEERASAAASRLIMETKLAEEHQHSSVQLLEEQQKAQKARNAEIARIEAELKNEVNAKNKLLLRLKLVEAKAEGVKRIAGLFVGMFRLNGIPPENDKAITAEAIVDHGAELVSQQFGDQPALQAALYNDLGMAYQYLGRHMKAEGQFQTSLNKLRATLGLKNRDAIDTMHNLTTSLFVERKFKEAEPFCRKMIRSAAVVYGEEHARTLTAISNLAMTLYAQKKLTEAAEKFSRSLEMRRRVLGTNHIKTIMSMYHLGMVQFDLGKINEAAALFQEASKTLEDTFPDKERLLADTQSRLGACLMALGKFGEAEPLLLNGYAVLRKQLGNDNEQTQLALKRIIAIYTTWGKENQAAQWRAKLPKSTLRRRS